MLLAITFSEFIVKINVIAGIVCAMFGVACILISRRFAQAVDKTSKITKSSKAYVSTNVLGLVLILAGMILIALPL